MTAAEKTESTYWDTGAISSAKDPVNPRLRFDDSAEGWQTSRIPEQVGSANVLDYGRAMFWQYLPDGLTKALLDEGGERGSSSTPRARRALLSELVTKR